MLIEGCKICIQDPRWIATNVPVSVLEFIGERT